MKRRPFTGLLPPVITPFRGGLVDEESIKRLVEYGLGGLDGMIVAGSTGEAPSMTMKEKRDVIRMFGRHIRGRMRFIVGLAETCMENIREIIKAGEASGAEGFLVPLSYYFHHDAETIDRFFSAVAAMTRAPLILYDNPYTTKTSLSPADIARVVRKNRNIRHVKLTDRSIDKAAALSAMKLPGVTLLAGVDDVMHHHVARGCRGVVAAVLQVYPRTSRRWFDALSSGRTGEARTHLSAMLPMIMEILARQDEYPAVVKHVLFRLGVLRSAETRLPLPRLSAARQREISECMEVHVCD